MLISKADQKNYNVAGLLKNLRQYLDIYRMIGLNIPALKEHGGNDNFWALIQLALHDDIVLSICKIYEDEDRWQRNSIPGVIRSIPDEVFSEGQRAAVARFGRQYGNHTPCSVCVRCHLKATLDQFTKDQKDAFRRIRHQRDKFGAHSEYGAKAEKLPLYEKYEVLFDFAVEFYRTVGAGLYNTTALMGGHGAVGTRDVMKKLGIKNPVVRMPTAP